MPIYIGEDFDVITSKIIGSHPSLGLWDKSIAASAKRNWTQSQYVTKF